jgi:adenylate cyclase
MMKLQAQKSSHPSREVISQQLVRMLSSPDFHATPQQTAFFKFVVNQTLAGNADRISGYTVATEVFGRRTDFDQSIDPVVSIQAARLRRALERYYLTAGKHDLLRILIPKGSYLPTFSEQRPSHRPITGEQDEPVSFMETWPTLLIRPLTNLTDEPGDNYLSMGLTAELTHALSHYREIRVLEALHQYPASAPPGI